MSEILSRVRFRPGGVKQQQQQHSLSSLSRAGEITLPVRLEQWTVLDRVELNPANNAMLSFAFYNRSQVLLGYVDVSLTILLASAGQTLNKSYSIKPKSRSFFATTNSTEPNNLTASLSSIHIDAKYNKYEGMSIDMLNDY